MATVTNPAFHVTGAVHHYVSAFGFSAPLYLGTAESTPAIRLLSLRKDVKADTHGPLLPAQRVEGGQMASISVALNRFSKTTLQALLAAIASPTQARTTRGMLSFGRTSFVLWQVFENYYNGLAGSYPGIEPGYYWPQVNLMGIDEVRLGNQDQLLVMNMEAHPYWVPQNPSNIASNTVAAGERAFQLYSQNSADFPADVTVPQ